MDGHPTDAAVREARGGRADGLADREVDVVRRHAQRAGAHPGLGQAGIDIHQGRAAGARQHPRVDRVVEVQHQVGASQHALGLRRSDADLVDAPVLSVAHRVQEDPAAHLELLHAREERRLGARVPVPVLAVAELLQPVDVTPEPAQPLDVLHVDPEVSPAFRKIRDVERGDDDGGHQSGSAGSSASNQRSTSASCSQPQAALSWITAAAGQMTRFA